MRPHTVLVYPDLAYSELQRPAPPYSILFIADTLRKADVEVDVFDLRYDTTESVLKTLDTYNPEYIGISTMTGPQIANALTIAKTIRQQSPETKLVWGGIHPTILPRQTLSHALVDIVVRGDGEYPFTRLVKGFDPLKIQGVMCGGIDSVHDGGLAPFTDMSDVNTPWDMVDAKRYVVSGRTSIVTSRGCPYRCAFCYNALLRPPWRGWSVEQCENELAQLVTLGAEDILFFDDAFFTDLDRVRGLLPYFKAENLSWTAELRVDRLTRTLAQEIKQSGCKSLFFGGESGSPRILKLLNKGVTVKQMLQSARITQETGLGADYSWMVGIPSETQDDRHDTISVIKAIQRLNPDAEFSIKIYTPYPGSPLFEAAVEQGLRMPESLRGWIEVSRYRASEYLQNRRSLETLALTSAVMGRQIFKGMHGLPMIFARSLATLRWRNEYFGLPWESFIYNILSRTAEQSSKGRLTSFLRRLSEGSFGSKKEETFAR
jgi:radical SAM superfamily enzyme YgiQ (UPF0313 family)